MDDVELAARHECFIHLPQRRHQSDEDHALIAVPGTQESSLLGIIGSTWRMQMKRIWLIIGLALCALPLQAQENASVVVKRVASASLTSSGQPIILPQGDVQVVVSTYEIAAGAVLPDHMHPFPRYGYVVAGMLRVTNTDTAEDREYKPGDFIVEAVGQWHKATTIGAEPVKLLVIDMMEQGKNNVILKK